MNEEKSNETINEPKWIAVYAISLAVAGLISSEFLPVSILTPIAKDLNVTEGIAGQAISITALIAMFSSLFTAMLTKTIDRRWVLLSFSVLQIISNLLVAFSPSFWVLMVGRVFLGVAVGGFWAMSTPTAMRLVPHILFQKRFLLFLQQYQLQLFWLRHWVVFWTRQSGGETFFYWLRD